MAAPSDSSAYTLRQLIELVQTLRAPEGCPWDREQTLPDLRAYLVEEAHETAAAIDSQDWDRIAEELGDLLFQAAFVVCLGEEAEALDLEELLRGIHQKMVARHPHVFGDETLADAQAVRQAWERRKLERSAGGLLDGVPESLPALVGAYRMSQKAAGIGFDWPDTDGVVDKIREELAEVETELQSGPSDRLRAEIGDLLFAVANLARHRGIDPEAALASTNQKFRRRFAAVEDGLRARGTAPGQADLETMEALWNQAKELEAD